MHLIAAFTAVMVLATQASAQTEAEYIQLCKSSGDVAKAATAARDKGVLLETTNRLVVETVTTPHQQALFAGIVRLVYAMDGVDGSVASLVAEQMCLKRFGLHD